MRCAVHSVCLLLAGLMLVPLKAAAQEAGDPSAALAVDADLAPAGPPLSAEESEQLARALALDPSQRAPATATSRTRGEASPYSLDISGIANPDGSGIVKLKRAMSEWDANLGADLNIAAPAADQTQPRRLLTASDAGNSTGAAWASIGVVENVASVDARLDGGSDQARLGTTLQRSMPIGSAVSLTVSDRYALSDTLAASAAAPLGLPAMSLPQELPHPIRSGATNAT